ncbi:SusC/RagA family TonB-linked outer membrane protein [Membranihabitans marinus]|uniref:SusC/RagA family TonB-linked outer membrane protein n=1 Tax=Membranihabitans marinus TaxID=1227546 RepID=UPI001F013043|nr:SusC/RagA family TonB-linked outer membrane protein [Membranihabitans marinus]
MNKILTTVLAVFAMLYSFHVDGKEVLDGIKLSEALDKISIDYNVYFTFDRDMASRYTVEYRPQELQSAEEAIHTVLSGTNLAYQIFDKQFVIIYRNDKQGLESVQKMVSHLQQFLNDKNKVVKNRMKKDNQSIDLLNFGGGLKSLKPFELNISGRVTSANGDVLIGVNILVKGSSKGTVTDVDGYFSIDDIDEQAVLVFSYIGYESMEVPVNGRTSINVILQEDSQTLNEVVVTALGIQRKTRDVGYSVQQLEGGSIQEAREVNYLNSLQGKLSGVQIGGNSGSMGGSSKVTIRGQTSISGDNNALFIVDGVPMANMNLNSVGTTGGQGTGGGGFDWGNPAQLINPNDIENIAVLKGAAATALYGSRGQNGVIYITTKTGKGAGKLSVNYDMNLQFDQVSLLPDYQNSYGGGGSPEFMKLYVNENPSGFLPGGGSYDDGDGKGRYDLIPAYGVDESWGPALDGRLVRHYWSWDADRNNPNFGIAAPWEAHPTNVEDFFETGVTFSNNLSVASSNENGSIRFSLGHTNQNFIYPGSDLERFFMGLNTTYKFTDQLTFSGGINYVNDGSKGRPGTGFYGNNPMLFYVMYGQRQINDEYFRNYKYEDGSEQGWNRRAWNIQQPAFTQSPYWNQYENYATDQNKRYYGNAGLTYKFSEQWSADVRVFSDDLNHLDETRAAKGFFVGSYAKRQFVFNETNYQATLNYKTKLSNKWSLDGVAGGNILSTRSTEDLGNTNGGLQSPDVYVLQNSVSSARIRTFYSRKQTNSLFASATLGYNNYLFVTATGRNDWASTLYQTGNYSYFYPSLAGSFIFTDLMSQSDLLTFGKLRLSLAQVGNDGQPYTVSNYYDYVESFGSYPLQTTSNSLFNADLKSELTSEVEAGLDLRFFKDRLSTSFTYYDRTTKNQIWNVQIPAETGFLTKVVNGGNVQNKGFEFSVSAYVIRADDFSWKSALNFSKNQNKVLDLNSTSDEVGGLERFVIGTERRTRKVSMVAEVGKSLGTMLGTDYVYDSNGNPLVGENGIYLVTSSPVVIGDVNPDFIGGFSNTFTYKGVYLSALLDFQKGGDFFSYTNLYGNKSGMLAQTAENGIRENGIIVPGKREDGTVNNVSISAQSHFNSNGGNRISKANLYDGSFIYLREVRMGWNGSSNLASKLGVEALRLTLTGRNLWLIQSNAPNVDPANITNSNGNQLGFEGGALPPVRSFGVNINLTL